MVLAPFAVLYGWWVTGLRPFSLLATAAVVGAGLGAALLAGTRRRPDVEPVAPAGAIVWAVLVVGLAAWQLAAFVQAPRADHPTLSSIANATLETRPVRAVAFAAWLAGAAWLSR